MADKYISTLENRGFQGSDANLATSLFEYGLIFKEYKRKTNNFNKGDILFYFGIGYDGEYFNVFDWGYINKNIDVIAEYDWVDFNAVASFVGITKNELLASSVTSIIIELVSYYGSENIFGSSYCSLTIGGGK